MENMMVVNESELVFIKMVEDLRGCSIDVLMRMREDLQSKAIELGLDADLGADGIEFGTKLVNAIIHEKDCGLQQASV